MGKEKEEEWHKESSEIKVRRIGKGEERRVNGRDYGCMITIWDMCKGIKV